MNYDLTVRSNHILHSPPFCTISAISIIVINYKREHFVGVFVSDIAANGPLTSLSKVLI